ncbi:malto-oligosyltrehalose trehalohydrolase [Anaeromyxobacter diazotrophicus]|nr:malto-oligosyltrehalose trehalohydrolase [Anaeromyxobacter diazotrophicus]
MTLPVHGPQLLDRGVRFSVWAPAQERLAVRVAGEERPLAREDGGWWSGVVREAKLGDRYQLVLPDGRALPDPASRRQPDGVHGPSQVWDARRYAWRHAFPGLPLEELAFYELHVGTFTPEGTLDAAAARLRDLVDLGVTCVELLPVQPFPGNRNWGYDGVSLHAVHEGYGGPEALQRFVDQAHALGLAVCLDVVYNHLGPEGNYLSVWAPYFTDRHKSPWGDGVNYDGPDAGPVRAYVLQAALQWVRDFRVDALRLDAVHAIPDDSPRHLVGALSDAVRAFADGSGRRIHVVAESDLEDRKVVDPPPGGWGCAAMWADDFHHAVHALLTGERGAFYQDFGGMAPLARALAEGFAFQGEPSRFRKKPWGTDTRGLAPSQFVFSLQNHDQVGNRPAGERLAALVPGEALFPLAALLLLGPGLPLLFMGEEYGEERPFLYFTSHGDPALAKAVSEGRKAEHLAEAGAGGVPDPQDEDTFRRSILAHRRDGRHGELWRHHRELLRIRRRHAAALGQRWPEVAVDGTSLALRRPGLEVEVNLGPSPAGGLPAWGWRVREG